MHYIYITYIGIYFNILGVILAKYAFSWKRNWVRKNWSKTRIHFTIWFIAYLMPDVIPLMDRNLSKTLEILLISLIVIDDPLPSCKFCLKERHGPVDPGSSIVPVVIQSLLVLLRSRDVGMREVCVGGPEFWGPNSWLWRPWLLPRSSHWKLNKYKCH